MKRILCFAGLVMLLTILGCSSPSDNGGTLTEKMNGSNIKMRVGDLIRVYLDGNPTTGFTWEKVEGDENIISQVGETKFESASSAIGSPGKVTMFFRAVSSGKTELRLAYERVWEKIAPAETFAVQIEVK